MTPRECDLLCLPVPSAPQLSDAADAECMTGVLELVLMMRLPILQQFGGVREISGHEKKISFLVQT
jgi:hypothetical protein